MPHNMNDIGKPKDLALHRIAVAKEDLETAEFDLQANHLRAANNRAYYSIYHAITAILALDQIAFKRHKDTLAYFNKGYIKTEIFPRPLGHRISIAQEIRHASVYDEFYVVSREESEEQIETAKQLLAIVTNYIQEKE